jgi:hypothetical protein
VAYQKSLFRRTDLRRAIADVRAADLSLERIDVFNRETGSGCSRSSSGTPVRLVPRRRLSTSRLIVVSFPVPHSLKGSLWPAASPVIVSSPIQLWPFTDI